MRLSEEMKPKLIAGGITLLLAPVLWMLLDSGSPPEQLGADQARAEEMFGARVDLESLQAELENDSKAGDAAATVARIESVGPESFGALISPDELNTFSSAALSQVVKALEKRLLKDPGSKLLETESKVIAAAVSRQVSIDDPGEALAILRQHAIAAGGLERFRSVTEKFIKHHRLARWLADHDRTDPGWILESAALLGDREIAAQWAPLLLWETGASEPSLELSAEWARSLAYLAGSTRDRTLKALLARYREPSELERRPGGNTATANRISLWLEGVERLAEVEAGLEERPSSSAGIDALTDQIEAAVLALEAVLSSGREERGDPGLSARLGRRAVIDLTRARIAGARLREKQTSLPPTGSL